MHVELTPLRPSLPEETEVHHLVEGERLLRADGAAADAGAVAAGPRHPLPRSHRGLAVLLRDAEQGAPVALRVLPRE